MTKYNFLALSLLLCTLHSCTSEQEVRQAQEGQKPFWAVETLETPIPPRSGEGNVAVAPDGSLYVSWVLQVDSLTHALQYAQYQAPKWTSPQTIAQGKDWFVNWADFPSMAAQQSGNLVAHWLQKSSGGTYDYDIKVSQQAKGEEWQQPFTLHQDGIPAEHGFVSMQAFGENEFMAVWLDGRNTKEENGAMTLRAGIFDTQGKRQENSFVSIDERICDCCQTDLAMTPQGAVVVYRDRSEQEIRDIYIARYQQGQWSKGKPVSKDHWLIKGCPVNGPAVASQAERVAVAWFTGANKQSKVKVAISANEGESFLKEVVLDSGASVLGRVDIAWTTENHVAISWMATSDSGAVIKVAHLDSQGNIAHIQTVAKTESARSSGFPILAYHQKSLYLLYRGLKPVPQVKLLKLTRYAPQSPTHHQSGVGFHNSSTLRND